MEQYKLLTKDPSGLAETAVKQLSEVKSVSKEIGQAVNIQKQNEALQLAESS